MSRQDVENRVAKLRTSLPEFSQLLGFALQYIDSDPHGSLNKARSVLETLVHEVYRKLMGGEPRDPELGAMLVNNQFTRQIERRILSRMNSIRDMGNMGSHQPPVPLVKPNDAVRGLDDLCEVLEWYLQRYPPIPPTPSASPDRMAFFGPALDEFVGRVLSGDNVAAAAPTTAKEPTPGEHAAVEAPPGKPNPDKTASVPDVAANLRETSAAHVKPILPPPPPSFLDDAIAEIWKSIKEWGGGWLRFVWLLGMIAVVISRTPSLWQTIENYLRQEPHGEELLFLLSWRGLLLVPLALLVFSVFSGVGAALQKRRF